MGLTHRLSVYTYIFQLAMAPAGQNSQYVFAYTQNTYSTVQNTLHKITVIHNTKHLQLRG